MSGSAYTQVKISVEPELARSFKSACMAANVSMSGVISRYMAKYSGHERPDKPARLATKRQRRAAIARVVEQLERIRDSQEHYRDSIPENLQNSIVFESADHWVSTLDETLDLLTSIE